MNECHLSLALLVGLATHKQLTRVKTRHKYIVYNYIQHKSFFSVCCVSCHLSTLELDFDP